MNSVRIFSRDAGHLRYDFGARRYGKWAGNDAPPKLERATIQILGEFITTNAVYYVTKISLDKGGQVWCVPKYQMTHVALEKSVASIWKIGTTIGVYEWICLNHKPEKYDVYKSVGDGTLIPAESTVKPENLVEIPPASGYYYRYKPNSKSKVSIVNAFAIDARLALGKEFSIASCEFGELFVSIKNGKDYTTLFDALHLYFTGIPFGMDLLVHQIDIIGSRIMFAISDMTKFDIGAIAPDGKTASPSPSP